MVISRPRVELGRIHRPGDLLLTKAVTKASTLTVSLPVKLQRASVVGRLPPVKIGFSGGTLLLAAVRPQPTGIVSVIGRAEPSAADCGTGTAVR